MADRRQPQADASETDADESFLDRWSRRKRAAAREQPPTPKAPSEPGPAPDPAAPPKPEPTDADLPPPEALGPDSDYSGYLSSRVSEGVKRAALRRLFRLPQFNVRDGLDDYDEDYRSFSALGDTVTADMRHHEERLREKERLRQEQARKTAGEDRHTEPLPEAEQAQAPTGQARGDESDDRDDADEAADPDEDSRHA